MHIFLPQNTILIYPDRVLVKRMIPCVWSFMKRKRTKDYVRLFNDLISKAEDESDPPPMSDNSDDKDE